MLEPHVLIALQEFYQREFGVSETPPDPSNKTVMSIEYGNHHLLFDWVPGLKLPKVNPKAIAQTVARLRGEEDSAIGIATIENSYSKIFEELKATFGEYAAFAYAEICAGKPTVFFDDEEALNEARKGFKG